MDEPKTARARLGRDSSGFGEASLMTAGYLYAPNSFVLNGAARFLCA